MMSNIPFPDFKKINETIEDYNNIAGTICEVELLLNDCSIKSKARIEIDKGDLYATIQNAISQPLEQKYFRVKFLNYISDKAFVVETKFGANLVKNTSLYEYKISLNDIHINKCDSYNVIVFNKHKNMNRLDTSISFGPMQGIVKFDDNIFHLYYLNEKTFAILSEKCMTYDLFIKYVFSIKMAIDFVHCEVIGGNAYVFSYDNKIDKINDFKILKLSQGYRLNFDIFIDTMYPISAVVKDIEMKLSTQNFATLCEKIFSNSQFQTMIWFILQAANVPIECAPVFLSIALEANAKLDKNENLYVNNSVFERLKYNISNTIDKETELTDDEKDVFKGKIQNRCSNNNALKKPFSDYGILLSDDEIKVLKERNKFLHGTAIEYSTDVINDIENYMKKSRMMYFILYEIILKRIGYEGYILNIEKWKEIIDYNNTFHSRNKNASFNNNFIKSLK